MNKRVWFALSAFVLAGASVFAQDLKIEFRLDAATAAPGNYFSFTGPIRYIAVDKDYPDSATGASKLGSTELFQPYLYDVKGRNTLPTGLRGLFLFAVNPHAQKVEDKLNVTKASDGTITVNYVHRGTAYQLTTDKSGRFVFPNGAFSRRNVGFIEGAGPQVISKDFSKDGTSAGIDWAKVWNPGIADGKDVVPGKTAKTGKITTDLADPSSMYYWEGTLQAALTGSILTITGGLTAVKR